MEGRLDAALKHLQEKAGMTELEAKENMTEAILDSVNLRSKMNGSVKVDRDRIFSYQAVRSWLAEDRRRCVGRFGNFCCFAAFNPQLPKQL